MQIIQGSILDFKGEAIVNPANSHMRHSGGLAAVINRDARGAMYTSASPRDAGGYGSVSLHRDPRGKQWATEQEAAPLVATGNAIATSAGCLPFKAVIHAVGPVWNGGHFYEDQLLMLAHRSALRVARAEGIRSIAFPAISAGVFGFPAQAAAYNAVRVLSGPDAIGLDVTLYLFADAHMEAYSRAAGVVA